MFCSPGEVFAREGDNAVFFRELWNLFNRSCMKVGFLQARCVHIFGRCLEATITSLINPLGTLLISSEMQCIFVKNAIIT